MEATKVLIDLESLLDIRQAKLSTLLNDDDKLAKIVTSEDYNFRKNDDFSKYVNMDNYKDIKHDISLIKKSTITYMIYILRNKVLNLDLRNSYLNKKYNYEILINFNGFNLTSEQINLICKGINVKLNLNAIILPSYFTVEDLSPGFLNKSDFAFIYLYDFNKWINAHILSLENIVLDKTIFYFPSIYYNDLNIVEENEKSLKDMGFNDGFNLIEFIFSEKLKIKFLPILFYSNLLTSEIYLSKINSKLKETPLGES